MSPEVLSCVTEVSVSSIAFCVACDINRCVSLCLEYELCLCVCIVSVLRECVSLCVVLCYIDDCFLPLPFVLRVILIVVFLFVSSELCLCVCILSFCFVCVFACITLSVDLCYIDECFLPPFCVACDTFCVPHCFEYELFCCLLTSSGSVLHECVSLVLHCVV